MKQKCKQEYQKTWMYFTDILGKEDRLEASRPDTGRLANEHLLVDSSYLWNLCDQVCLPVEFVSNISQFYVSPVPSFQGSR